MYAIDQKMRFPLKKKDRRRAYCLLTFNAKPQTQVSRLSPKHSETGLYGGYAEVFGLATIWNKNKNHEKRGTSLAGDTVRWKRSMAYEKVN